MEKTITRPRLPNTDSIQKLARFWDTHDVTDFEADLEEAAGPVFVREKGAVLSIELPSTEAQQLRKIARSQGVKETTVLRQWIRDRLQQCSSARRPQATRQKTRRG